MKCVHVGQEMIDHVRGYTDKYFKNLIVMCHVIYTLIHNFMYFLLKNKLCKSMRC